MNNEKPSDFVSLFRASAPYINAFRGRSFVIYFGGEAIADAQFASLVHDIALLHSLGLRIVLVHGARPQIDAQRHAAAQPLINDVRITDDETLHCVKTQIGHIRTQIEALFSMGLANSPMEGSKIHVASGNYITAKPFGIRDGVDFQHTGEVRRIDIAAITRQLEQHSIVLLSPLGYSPTGETFNLFSEDVAFEVAKALRADKLLCLLESDLITDAQNKLIKELSFEEVDRYLQQRPQLDYHRKKILLSAVECCKQGVQRVHLLNRHHDGALLQELFTRDGIGSLISSRAFEGTRPASVEDVPGILELISPLEEEGILVRRSREKLEMDIKNFTVVERDGMIVACAALFLFSEQHAAELACLAVHPDYRKCGRGDELLHYIQNQALNQAIQKIYVLSTRTSHWFLERGFQQTDIESLPFERQSLYNYQRQSKVFVKALKS